MKKSLTLFMLFVGMSFLFSSCGSTDAAEKTANTFFKRLVKGDFAKANKLVKTGFAPQLQLKQVTALGKSSSDGKLLSAKKITGFSTQIIDGVTSVTLPYTLKYEKNELFVEVTLVDDGDGFTIRKVNY